MSEVKHTRRVGGTRERAIHFVDSASHPGSKHFVRLEPTPACSCKGFAFRGDCRHLDMFRTGYSVERVYGGDCYGSRMYQVFEHAPKFHTDGSHHPGFEMRSRSGRVRLERSRAVSAPMYLLSEALDYRDELIEDGGCFVAGSVA